MIQLFLNGKPVQVKSSTKIKLTIENSFYRSGSEYTYEVELPLQLDDNRNFFGALGRLDVAKSSGKYEARLLYNNRTVLDGSAVITQITDHSVKLQLLGRMAAQNNSDKEDSVYIDELELGNFAADLDPANFGKTATGPAFAYGRTGGNTGVVSGVASWATNPNTPIQFYPCRNTSVDAVANDWAVEVNSAGTALDISWVPCKWREANSGEDLKDYAGRIMAPQPMLWFLLKKIAAAIGSSLDDADNIFKNDPFLARIFLPFAGGYSQYNVNLPHWTIGEFWTELQNAFGVVVDSAPGGGMRVRSRTTFYKTTTKVVAIERLLDEYTVETEDDNEADISVSNVGFAESEFNPVDCLDEAVRGSAKIDRSFDDIAAIIAHMSAMSSASATAWRNARRDTIFECKDGRHYVYFADNDGTPAFRRVDMYAPRIVKENSTDVDVELKFVPCALAQHEFRAFKHISGGRHPGAAAYDPAATFTGWLVEHPDRTDTLDTAANSDADIVLEELIMGDGSVSTDEEKKPDLIYMALTPLAWNQINVTVEGVERPVLWPRPSMAWGDRRLDGTYDKLDDGMSLSLNKATGETNLYTATIGSDEAQEVVIDTTLRYCIKFVDTKVPEVDSIFLLHNQKYVCEKIECDLPTNGGDMLITGYFYRITL